MKKLVVMILFGFLYVQSANASYLTQKDSLSGEKLLPNYPQEKSAAFEKDKEAYKEGVKLRNTKRGTQATIDADYNLDSVLNTFSDAFGIKLSKQTTPEIYELLKNVHDDENFVTNTAKKHYNRTRPFVYYNTHTCDIDAEKYLKKNGSYPSGHTTMGWALALVLAEINPSKSLEILKRGYEYGQSRVICGAHWQSDVDAGRVTGSALYSLEHSNHKFNAQLRKAKKEFRAIKHKNKKSNKHSAKKTDK